MKEAFINSIQYIINKDTNEKLEINSIKCELFTNKYSAKKASIWCLFINDKQIKKKDNYIFNYKCIVCSTIHNVSTTQILRKINSLTQRCYLCRNNIIRSKEPSIDKSLTDIRNEQIDKFNNLDDEFKDNYFKLHLTDIEYEKLKKNIKSFNNNNHTDINNYEYWPIYKADNQMIFTSVIYDRINNTIFKAHQPIIKCDNCNLYWRTSSIVKFKNNIKIMCKDCSCVNKIFKIRQTKNINNELILYQSKLELKFITWCNNNGIILYNGPKVEYVFNEKSRVYRVDFRINNILIEIKDNHIWHQNDVKSGKWLSKEDAVKKLVKNNIYEDFYFINPSNWDNMVKKLIKYSLTSYESKRNDSLNTLV
jgi:hypothetical protein